MRDKFLALCSGTILCLATATTAMAVDNPEVEDNNTKAAANAVTLAAGDSVSGTTTGTSTVAGLGSLDYFRVKTTAAALDVYRHRLTQTAGSVSITPTIRGLNQSGGVIGTTDTTIQTGALTPELVQWYGFGKEEELYFRLAGTTATTAGYQYDLSTTTVSVIAGPTSLIPGTITISRAGHTTDTDFWVYDSNYDAIADFGNDDPNTMTRTFAPGSYLLAISNFNFANNQPAATGETFLSGAVMDFANVIVNSSTSTALNVATRFTDAAGDQDVAATKVGAFDVVFISFTVEDSQVACCFGDGSCQDLLASECITAGGRSAGIGSDCDPNPCPEPEACCFPDGSCTDIAPAFCAGIAQGLGSNCDPNPCPQPEACCFGDTSCTVVLATACATAGGTAQGAGSDCMMAVCPDTNPGQNCNNPIEVDIPGALPYADLNTTQGKINDYSTTCMGSYDGGEDILYELIVSDPICVNITLDGSVAGGSIWLGMGLDDECPLAAAGCIRLATTSAAIDTMLNQALAPGTYYLMIDTFPSPNFAAYNLTIEECPTVACCLPDGTCADVYATDCVLPGGLSQGAGSLCANVVCPAPEACCYPDGSCLELAPFACVAPGVNQGAGSSCTPNICPPPQACCFIDGSCSDVIPAICAAGGGISRGAGTSCGAGDCSAVEACCLAFGGCSDISPLHCDGVAGGVGSDCAGTMCPAVGACCLPPNNECLQVIEAACVDLGGSFLGGPCPTPGGERTYTSNPALSIPDSPAAAVSDTITVVDTGTLTDVNIRMAITHTFLGDLDIFVSHNATNVILWSRDCGGNDNMDVTADDEAGALVCAQPTLGSYNPASATALAFLSAYDGMDVNGAWTLSLEDQAGADTGTLTEWQVIATLLASCNVDGACCLPNGVCVEVFEDDCTTAGGAYQGDGSECMNVSCPLPACCFTDGSCQLLTGPDCVAQGGVSQGAGSSCTPNPCPQPEACCFLDGSCQDLLVALCAAAGGESQGPGTDCDPNLCPAPGACCLPDDLCLFTLPNTCASLGGSFVGGACGLTAAVRGYESTPNAVIPDSPVGAFPTVDVINVPENYGIADVDVELEITHTFLGDLDIRLSHNATNVFLWQDACVGNDNMNVTADDEAGAVVCATPTLGSYAPSTAGGGALSAFDGQNANGAWTLAIDDDAGGDTGFLVRWKLNITPLAAVCIPPDPCIDVLNGDANCDGSVNNFDIDYFVAGIVDGPTGATPPDVPPTASAAYLALGGTEDCWAKRRCWGDINCDGVFNNFDIDPFVDCVVNTPLPGDPCPLCVAQACCLPGGLCTDIRPAGCVLLGGVPQGPGSSCASTVCP
ncbi:MAG: proprotein convertase P-domain-containing protein [Phycisphaerales bacterium]|nr:proprotein convertase P-domain-containing protein [Phycisphaerales bacterium]